MIPVSFYPEAREELIEAAGYYENQQVLLGRQFFVSIHDSIDHIQSFPSLYREIEPGIRQCRVSRFPYGLIYRAREDEIQIIAVMHLHREPGYWKTRKT